jgi:hypothetical protein
MAVSKQGKRGRIQRKVIKVALAPVTYNENHGNPIGLRVEVRGESQLH